MKDSRHRLQAFAASVLVFVALAPLGCGPAGKVSGPRAPIEGTVTLNGKPVDGGKILFLPVGETDNVKTHGEIVNGKYALDKKNGPNLGTYKIEVVWYKKTGKKVMNDGKEIEQGIQVVPEIYNSRTKTTIEIKPDNNVQNIEMIGEPPNPKSVPKVRKDGN